MSLQKFSQFKSFLLTGLLLMLSYISMAQSSITGKVLSAENQQPVSGATVIVKGTKIQTTTDNAGTFKLTAAENAVLLISNVGFISQEVKAADAASVLLQVDSKNLDEVVVTALGIRKEKRNWVIQSRK